jgi:hypothetical protein
LAARSVCYVRAEERRTVFFSHWLSAPPDVCQLLKVDLYSATV